MTTNQVAKLIAVCIGSFLLVTAIADAGRLVISAQYTQIVGGSWELLSYALVPILSAAIFSYPIYAYSKRLSVANVKPSEIELLAVGIKLLGIFALLRSIPYLAAVLAIHVVGMFDLSEPILWKPAARDVLVSLGYLSAGYLMVFRTFWIIDRATRDV